MDSDKSTCKDELDRYRRHFQLLKEIIVQEEYSDYEHLPAEDTEEPRHVGLGVRWFTSHGMGGALSRKLQYFSLLHLFLLDSRTPVGLQ